MLNKKNAAYAVFGFALVGCNNVLAGCDCCKGVPKELEKFTVIFKNLKGVTYATLDQYFKKENCKDEILGKDLISGGLVKNKHNINTKVKFFIVSIDDKKNEMKVYEGTTEEETKMKNAHNGKKYRPIEIKFKAKDGSTLEIKQDEDKKFEIDTIELGKEETIGA